MRQSTGNLLIRLTLGKVQMMEWGAGQVRALRHALRLGQEDFARHVGAAARTVRNWESGQNGPSLALQRELDGVLEVASDDQRRRFLDRLAARSTASDRLPESEEMDRQEFLRVLLAAGGAAVLNGPFAGLGAGGRASRVARTRRTDPRVVADFAQLTAGYRHLYWSLAPTDIIGPATAHAGMGLDLLREATGALRQELAAPVTESLLLVGRVEFFDLRRPGQALSYLEAAADTAEEIFDAGLQAAVTAHRSFVPAFADRGPEAVAIVDHALERATFGGVSASTRAWLHAVEAEVKARAGDAQGTLRALGHAEGLLEDADAQDDPEWMDFFDRARLDGFKGYSYLSVGRPAEAREALTRTLNALTDDAQKQRAVTLADLAATQVQVGEIEAAAQLAQAALQVTVEERYATAAERLLEVRAALEPFRRHATVVELDEALRLAQIG